MVDSQVGNYGTQPNIQKIKSFEYDKWDKYDAEEECRKIDLEEEKKKEEKEKEERRNAVRRKKEAALVEEERVIEEIKASIRTMTDAEKNVYAMKEKDLGNEYYYGNDLDKAIKHYTRSITIFPTARSHNNRAAAFLKQCKYSKALEDTNIVLQMDPDNVKAYFRRALSLQHKNEFHKALDDVREVLRREPNHVIARHVADQLREHCQELPRKCKLRVKDETGKNPTKVIEVTEEEMLRDYKDKDFVEVNDWGLPKIMCNCNGKYTNDPGIRNNDKVRFQHLNLRSGGKKKVEEPKTFNGGSKKNIEEIGFEGAFGGGDSPMELERPHSPLDAQFSPGQEHSGKPKRLEILEVERMGPEPARAKTSGGSKGKLSQLADLERLADGLTGGGEGGGKRWMAKEEKEAGNRLRLDEGEASGSTFDKSLKDKLNFEEKTWERLCDGNEGTDCGEGVVMRQTGDKRPKDEGVGGVGSRERTGGGGGGEGKKKKPKGNVGEEALELLSTTPSPIQVATKYREKVSSQKQSPTVLPVQPNGSQSEAARNQGKLRRLEGEATSPPVIPFNFYQSWAHISRKAGAGLGLEEKTRLLRSVRPHLLKGVIGIKLEVSMLADFLLCLSSNFSLQTEAELIIEYLTAIMELDRFYIAYSMLSDQEKSCVRSLLEMLGPSVNKFLQRAYC